MSEVVGRDWIIVGGLSGREEVEKASADLCFRRHDCESEIRREPWDTWGQGQVLFVDGRDVSMPKC